MMNEMMKRVSEAIINTPNASDYEYLVARNAIRAMREPTNAMKSCSDEIHWGYSCHVCGGLTEGWYAMIDKALADV